MKRLTNLKNFTLALVFTAISVISWGQTECTSLNDCVIKGVSDYYNLDDNNPISVTFTVLWANDEEYTLIAGADKHYTYSFFDKDGNSVNNPIANEGFYRLIITGTEVVDEYNACYTGTITKDFYVIKPSDHTLEETGEQTNPYIINDESDWWALATHSEYQASNKFVKLNQNLTLGAISGENITKSGLMIESFKGHFDGDGHTLTFYYTGQGEEGVPVAPFQYTDNASFSNLIVNGEIKKYVYGSAGLIGHNTGTTNVYDVIVGLNINCGYWNGEMTVWSHRCGGFAVDGSGVAFNKCIYDGVIKTVEEDRNGGFCGKGSAKTSFTNCLFYPNLEESKLNGVIFANGGDDYSIEKDAKDAVIGTVNNSYYTFDSIHQVQYGQGTFAYASVAKITNGVLAQKKTMTNNVRSYNIYEPVTVTIDEDIYTYTGSDITPVYSVYFNGVEKTLGTDYTAVIKNSSNQTVTVLHDEGNYTLVITGVPGADYYGYTEKVLMVIPADATWEALQGIINEDVTGEITLNKDYYASSGDTEPIIINVNKTIVINLNGHTINRNLVKATDNGQVLRIVKDKNGKKPTVTINGPGVITGGYHKEVSGNVDGGGIYNMGILTLNKVTVSGNKCEKKNPNSTTATGRGGGIYSGNGSTLNINGCNIRENEAQGGAGGIFADQTYSFVVGDYTDSETTIHTSINSNRSLDKGGGIRVRNSTTAIITNCSISNNEVNNMNSSSVANGGGIHLDNGNLTLNNCTIDRNTASKYGGGIYAIAGKITATDCHIDFNQSYDSGMNYEGHGGGVYMYGGTFKMYGGSINENASNIEYGGGIYISSAATFVIKNSDNNSISINGNWTFDEDGKKKITNVYLAGTSIIQIEDNISGSTIGVANNVGESIFTNGLKDNGTSDIFTSDDDVYMIQSYEEGEKLEAKFEIASPWVPTPDDPEVPGVYTINNAVVISDVYEAVGVTIGSNGSVTIVPGGCLNTTSITNTDPTKLIIYGGQLITNSENVQATMKKDITGALALSSEYWYLISSGIASPNIKENTNLIKLSANDYSEYDLYRFNEAVNNNKQWENYRQTDPEHDDFCINQIDSYLENGRGYLYRNANDYTITISGTLNSAAITTPTLTCEGNVLTGFNIIGNPYPHNIKKGDGQAIPNGDLLESNYYVLLEDGRWEPVDDGDEIHVMEGILVQAKTNGALTISKIPVSAPASKGERDIKTSNKIWFTINNDEFRDRACVEFKQGHGLNKIAHINEEAPMLYVNYNGEDFASVDMSKDVKSINLNFDAKTTGYYTLSMKSDGEFDYIHLIDRLTGDDIDMLQEEEYTFIGSASDNADRFLVKLSPSTGSGTGLETFAWQNGNDIIVNGNGELQVFDVMGRMVATRHINGVQTINLTQTGVYIFRLEGKTQKIIVR